MSKSILGFLLALILALPLKAEQPIFTIDEETADQGQIVEIDFRVDNFSDIISAQFSINWDPSVLSFREVKNLNPNVTGMSQASFNVETFIAEGKIPFQWLESSVNPITLPDGSIFFTIEFEVIGSPCQQSDIAITDDPTEIEVAEEVGGVETRVDLMSNVGNVTIPGTNCGQDIHLEGNSLSGDCGSNVCVQFTVQNFTDVVAMEFSMVYDPSILEFTQVRNFANLPGFNSGSTHLVSPGTFNVVWTSSNAENESLPNGTVLFELCFNVIGTGGQSSTITFGDVPEVGFFDEDSNPHNVTITPAMITSNCALEGFALIAEDVCTQPGEITCIDISVNDFEDISAMQFSINWNPAFFEFDHLEGFNLPELNEDAFGTPPDVPEGQLSVVWFTIDPATVPDLTTIFTLCLRAVGPAGSSSSISFTSNPTEIEVATEDSVLVLSLINSTASIQESCDTVPCQLEYTLIPTSPECPREATGSLNLTVDVGTCGCTPTYVWSFEGRTTEDLLNVEAGDYTVTITCGQSIIVASETISDPPPIEVSGIITSPSPAGSSTGSINLTVTGGTPGYTFVWSTNPPVTTEDLVGIPAGNYFVTITDANGCSFIPDAFVVGADIVAMVTNVFCFGECSGAISVTPSFGVPAYTYAWSNGANSSQINNLCAGQYCVTITDSNGMSRDSCFSVTQPPTSINVTATITPNINGNGGAIDLHVTGGVPPYSYQWSNPPGSTTQDVANLPTGQYCVTITNNAVCVVDTCFQITEGAIGVSLNVLQFGSFQTSCASSCDGEIMTNILGGTPPFTYKWSRNNESTEDLLNVCAGLYTVTVTDATGSTAAASTTITSPAPINVQVLETFPTDFTTTNGAITIIPGGGIPPYTYQWGPVTGNTPTITNLAAATYSVTVTDANDCELVRNIPLFPDDQCFEATRVITPNDDGKNDYLLILCIQGFNHHLFIFNRNGGLVYETDDYQNNWAGYDNDNEALPDGGYLWVVEYTDHNGFAQIARGTVNLLRTAD